MMMVIVMLSSVALAADDTVKIKLNVWERIRVKEFLPQRASFEKAIISNDLSKKIEFTQEEVDEYEMKTEGSAIIWNKKGADAKEYEFTYLEVEMLKDGVEKMSKDEKIEATDPFLELCKKIRGAGKE